MLSTDISKSVELSYNEDVYIKDGVILFNNAPLGAYIDIEVLSGSTVVGSFAKGYLIYNIGNLLLDSEDKALLTQELKLRVTVFNSTGSNGDDPAADFNLIGNIEYYRTTTI